MSDLSAISPTGNIHEGNKPVLMCGLTYILTADSCVSNFRPVWTQIIRKVIRNYKGPTSLYDTFKIKHWTKNRNNQRKMQRLFRSKQTKPVLVT